VSIGVTFTAYNRPNYLEATLATWRIAKRAISYPYYFSLEPDQPAVLEVVKKFPYTERVWENPYVRGALVNPWFALKRAFKQGHDFVILAEDDAIVSPDIFDYFERMARQFGDHPEVFAICSFNRRVNGHPDQFHRRNWFASTVWGLTRERWEREVHDHWGFTYMNTEWDKRFVHWIDDSRRVCVFPCVSRSQHIGRENGTHMTEEEFEPLQANAFYTGPGVDVWKEKILVSS